MRDALLASVAGEIRRLTKHVEELHFLDITGRLAAMLVRLAEENGTFLGPDQVRLQANLTQSDLASMVGCTRQSVNKLLGQFHDAGFLRMEREGILITDLGGLVRAARPLTRGRPAGVRSVQGLEQDPSGDQGCPTAAGRATQEGHALSV